MLVRKKKLVEAVATWFEKADKDDKGNWHYEDDTVSVLPSRAIFQTWNNYRRTGSLPESGGWHDQPLDVVVQMGVIQTAYETFEYKSQKDAKWELFTPTQIELIRRVDSG